MTTAESINSALRNYARLDDAILIKRTDHPNVDGDYYYAIRRSEKRLWTAGETVLTADEIKALWYAADCPDVSTKTCYPELAGIRIVRPTTTERKVARAAAKAASARAALDEAIREAREAGVPLRVVADAAGVSHEQIRRIAG